MSVGIATLGKYSYIQVQEGPSPVDPDLQNIELGSGYGWENKRPQVFIRSVSDEEEEDIRIKVTKVKEWT